jgi:hypothetical protein
LLIVILANQKAQNAAHFGNWAQKRGAVEKGNKAGCSGKIDGGRRGKNGKGKQTDFSEIDEELAEISALKLNRDAGGSHLQ